MSGSRRVNLVNSVEELNDFIKINNVVEQTKNSRLAKHTTSGYWILEEYIDGFELSVEAVKVKGITTIIQFHNKVNPVEPPEFIEGILSTHSSRLSESIKCELETQTDKILDALGFDNGAVHIEFRVINGKPILVEVNARPGGQLIQESIYYSTGIKLNEVCIDICLNNNPMIKHKVDIPVVFNGISPPIGKINSDINIDHLLENEELKIVHLRLSKGDCISHRASQAGILLLYSGDNVELLESLAIKNQKEILINLNS